MIYFFRSDSDKINPKKPLSTVQVFRELISSRLAQGFQIIVLSASTSPVSQSKLVPGQQYSMGLMRARPRQEPSVSATGVYSLTVLIFKLNCIS